LDSFFSHGYLPIPFASERAKAMVDC
jgi:hypothetical protein